MHGFTKLFSSILFSTVWLEPNHVRIMWITMLALSDKDGIINASIPGLAKAANLKISECKDALKRFQKPDEHSRTPDNEGRRIKTVDGGWLLLNHAKYRGKLKEDKLREQNANRQRRFRERNKVTKGNVTITDNAHTDTDTDTDTDQRQTQAGARAHVNKEEMPSFGQSPMVVEAKKMICEMWKDFRESHAEQLVIAGLSYMKKCDWKLVLQHAREDWPDDQEAFAPGGRNILHTYLMRWFRNESGKGTAKSFKGKQGHSTKEYPSLMDIDKE